MMHDALVASPSLLEAKTSNFDPLLSRVQHEATLYKVALAVKILALDLKAYSQMLRY